MHRFVRLLGVVAVGLAVACIDMSAPKGAASISVLQLPSPSVVVGDTMRDSLGKAAPLTVVAYDGNNARLTDISPLFFISDTTHTAHLKGGNVLVGDKPGSVQLIGQIGSLQTPPATVPVTFAPTKIVAVPLPQDTLRAPFPLDSATSIASMAIGALVLGVPLPGGTDSVSQGFVVKYDLKYAPVTKAGSKSPAVYFVDGQQHVATADTTHATGASRQLTVNSSLLADPALLGGTKVDSAVVEVSTKYKGVLVSGSPVRFVVLITVLPPALR
jgi:hypothetical protein